MVAYSELVSLVTSTSTCLFVSAWTQCLSSTSSLESNTIATLWCVLCQCTYAVPSSRTHTVPADHRVGVDLVWLLPLARFDRPALPKRRLRSTCTKSNNSTHPRTQQMKAAAATARLLQDRRQLACGKKRFVHVQHVLKQKQG